MRTSLAIGMALGAAALLALPAPAQVTVKPRSGGTVVAVAGASSYLGIGVQDIDSERAKTLKLKEDRGAEVTNVTDDSPAAKAGIKEGDVITEYNGQPVEGGAQLTRMVRETPVGRQVKVTVWRNGAPQALTATVEARKGATYFSSGSGGTWVMPEMPAMPPMPPTVEMPHIEIPRFQVLGQSMTLGIMGESLANEEQLADFFGVKEGVLVKEVIRNSPAEKAGIKAGDVIVKVDDNKVYNTQDITSALRSARSKKTYTVVVVRAKKEMPITVTTEQTGPAVRADGRVISKFEC
ncbi:MAG TPA: PDZ domain-containing protein [Bryobacteraceae bacterium]